MLSQSTLVVASADSSTTAAIQAAAALVFGLLAGCTLALRMNMFGRVGMEKVTDNTSTSLDRLAQDRRGAGVRGMAFVCTEVLATVTEFLHSA